MVIGMIWEWSGGGGSTSWRMMDSALPLVVVPSLFYSGSGHNYVFGGLLLRIRMWTLRESFLD